MFITQIQNALHDSVIQTILSLYVASFFLVKSDDIIEMFSRWKHALIKRKDTRKVSS